MKVEIWSDIACPHCYVGHLHLNKALSLLPFGKKVKIIHRAYQLNPQAELQNPLTAYEYLAKRKKVSLEQAQRYYDDLTHEIEQFSGLHLRYDLLKPTNTVLAHRVSKWARLFHKEHDVYERLFKAYFEEGAHLGDPDTLAKLMEDIGFDPQEVKCFLTTKQFEELVYAEHSEAKFDRHIRGVPYYLINGKREVYGSESIDTWMTTLQEEWEVECQPNVFSGQSSGEYCDSEGCKLSK